MYLRMLEAANEIYADYLSSGDNIIQVASKGSLLKLRDVIKDVKKEDFGISDSKEAHQILFNDSNTISYANIHSEPDERFSFGLFFIPKGGQLPLHDHPNMFVYSKILMGKVKRLSFSLKDKQVQFTFPQHSTRLQALLQTQKQQLQMQIQQEQELKQLQIQQQILQQQQQLFASQQHSTIGQEQMQNQQQTQSMSQQPVSLPNSSSLPCLSTYYTQQLTQAIESELTAIQQLGTAIGILQSEEILSEGWIDDLDPEHSNLHNIEALEDCVFFDVLLPHYDLKSRFCNYYQITSKPNSTNGETLLQIMTQPLSHSKVQYFTIDKATCSYFN